MLNRGVEKRDVVLDDKDYFRFIHDLFEFNDVEPAYNNAYFFNKSIDVGRQYIDVRHPTIKQKKSRKLSRILALVAREKKCLNI